jgi:hypothetical protein
MIASFDRLFADQFLKTFSNVFSKDGAPEFRTPHEVVIDVIRCLSSLFDGYKLIVERMFGSAKRNQPWRARAVS